MNIEARKNRKTHRQAVFLFGEDGPATSTVLGGKGAGLSEMVSLGLPVPFGFTVTTTVARAYSEHGRLPRRLSSQIDRGIHALERRTQKTFGATDGNPLLVSVRSGGATSMPGMMDTVLNLGLNPKIVEAMATRVSPRFAWENYRRYLIMYGEIVRGIKRQVLDSAIPFRMGQNPEFMNDQQKADLHREVCYAYRSLILEKTGTPVTDDPREQLIEATIAVFGSWNNERAVLYRKTQQIDDRIGTAVNVQEMVFGNQDESSATGVVFSRNTSTGAQGLWGEFLVNAQGEDVVSGKTTPQPIAKLQTWNPALYSELEAIAKRLEDRLGDVVDVEFTIESGKLHILQYRKAKSTTRARMAVAVRDVWARKIDKTQALERFTLREILASKRAKIDQEELRRHPKPIRARGIAASPGTIGGYVATSAAEAVKMKKDGEPFIVLVCNDTSPEDLPGLLAANAIVTRTGGATSHAAVVARGLNKPAVVGCGVFAAMHYDYLTVDGDTGTIYKGKVPLENHTLEKESRLLLQWAKKLGLGKEVPRLTFEDLAEEVNGNTLLNDFYLASAMAKELVDTTLETEATALKDEIHIRTAELIATYIAVAVAGELRHFRTLKADKKGNDILQKLVRTYTVEHGEYTESVEARSLQQHRVGKLLSTMRLEQQIEFFSLAEQLFLSTGWRSLSYGGSKWAAIARAGRQFLEGELPHTVFADHAFDLQHNSGTVFGKHPMIAVDRSRITRQLNAKKKVNGLQELSAALYRVHSERGLEVGRLLAQAKKLRDA